MGKKSAYDTLGNLTTVNQGGQTRTFAYTSLSRLSSAVNPESGTISYVFDKNGNLIQRTDARSIQTDYTYDALNRVSARNYSDSTPAVTYTYDNATNARGKLTRVTTGNPSLPFAVTDYQAFDVLGRVTQSEQTTDGTTYNPMTYLYDLAGNLLEEKYPSGRVVRSVLDENGDLSILQSKKNSTSGYWDYADGFTYNATGAVTSIRLGNGHWESTQFNSRLQPTRVALGLTSGATDLLKLDYTYGHWEGQTLNTQKNNGNIAQQELTVPTVGSSQGFYAMQLYSYDSLNRLGQATELINAGVSWQQTFSYDRYGNRNFNEDGTTTLTKSCGSLQNLTVCPEDRKVENPSISASTNRIVQDQDGDSVSDYTFDNAGNTTKTVNGSTFIYDAENKQIEVRNSSNVTTGQYWYDGDGKRVKKHVPATGEVTIFIYDAGGKLVAEYSTNPNPTPQVSYLTNDHLGSPRINTNESGAVISRHDYHPFGDEITGGSRSADLGYVEDDNRKQFTGYERDDETGLDFAQARMYTSVLGRFSTPDEFKNDSDVKDPQSWNKYAYSRNSPLVFVDPDGEKAKVTIVTDENTKTGSITVEASFGVYIAKGEYTKAEVEEQIKKIKAQFAANFNPSNGFIKDGINYSVTTNITVKVLGSESEAEEAGRNGKVDNIVGLVKANFIDGKDTIGVGYSLKGEVFDRMLISSNNAPYNNTYAHEGGHLFGGDGHTPRGSPGTMRPGAPSGGFLSAEDFDHIFATPIKAHFLGTATSTQVPGFPNRKGVRSTVQTVRALSFTNDPYKPLLKNAK